MNEREDMKSMKPNDIVYFEDKQFGHHRFWRIEGVFLGALGQESLVELRSLTERPGHTYGSVVHPTTLVPEPMLRRFTIYTPHIQR